MGSRKQKFYVVWQGRTPGVYATWAECQSAISGYPNAKYKSFPTRETAEEAFAQGHTAYWGTGKFVSALSDEELAAIGEPVRESLCVDAAWNMDTRAMEYRGVWLRDRSVAFRQGPFQRGTSNIGEFLAIVHALGYLKKRSLENPVYSDSTVAIGWVNRKNARSKAMQQGQTSAEINDLVQRALHWLNTNTYANQLLKWETAAWGEIPADYGRK